MFRDIFVVNGPMSKDFLWKSDPLQSHIPESDLAWDPDQEVLLAKNTISNQLHNAGNVPIIYNPLKSQ